jgi:hypothetical protein
MVTSYVPVDPPSMAIRETVAVDPEIAKSFANKPLTASVKTNLKVSESKPVVADVGANREMLVRDGAVVSISTLAEFENPDVPVFTPVTTARALNVCVPAAIFDGGVNAYAPTLLATVEPSGVELPSRYTYTVAPASDAPVTSGVRSLVGVATTTVGVATNTGTGNIHEITLDAMLSLPRRSTAVT